MLLASDQSRIRKWILPKSLVARQICLSVDVIELLNSCRFASEDINKALFRAEFCIWTAITPAHARLYSGDYAIWQPFYELGQHGPGPERHVAKTYPSLDHVP